MPRFTKEKAVRIALLGGQYGLSVPAIQDRFDPADCPSVRGINAVLKRWSKGAEGAELCGRTRGRSVFCPEVVATIKAQIDAEPRMFMGELAEVIAREHKMRRPSNSKIRKSLRRDLGYTRRRIEYLARQRDTADRISCLEAYAGPGYDANCAVFIDESHFSREYDRTYGWGPRGEPLVMTQQLADDVQYSWMAAADKDGLCHEMCELLDTSQAGGNVDGERFLGWARSRLFPGLGNYSRREARSIVVMDNCRLHHYWRFVLELQATGAVIFYLSAYSPDFNPIEMVFGFLKNKIAAQSLYTRDFTAAMRLAEAAEGITPALFQKWMRRSQAGKGLAVSSDEDEDEDEATILHFFLHGGN